MTIHTYDGTLPDGVLIASDTNPWVEVNGEPVDWTESTLPRVPCPCDEDHLALAPGVIDAMDTPEGIQRCDAAPDHFPGDLDAALVLARLVGGVVKFEAEAAEPTAFHIVNRDHADGKGRVRCECGSNTFTTTDPTDVDRFVGTFTCTICTQPWQTRNIVQRLQAVAAR